MMLSEGLVFIFVSATSCTQTLETFFLSIKKAEKLGTN